MRQDDNVEDISVPNKDNINVETQTVRQKVSIFIYLVCLIYLIFKKEDNEFKFCAMFEPEQRDCNDSNLLSTQEISLVTFPNQFSRNVSILEKQLHELLKSIELLRPLSKRDAVMPGIKNFVNKQRNMTNKNVRNICYMNSIIFFLSSIDEVVARALSFLRNRHSRWS